MNEVVKHRIEQIKQGEVPSGYKKTKVGIVPEEWEVKQLSQVLNKQTRKNIDNSIHNVLTNSATQGIISQSDYFDKQIANDENTDGYYIVENGYFVYNPRISVSAPCGPFNKYYGNDTGIMSPLYTVYKLIDKSPYYSEYLSYYYSSANWHRYMNEIANYGARSDRMNVTGNDMDEMPLPYPPLAEQEKIAEILAAQDKVIALKEKLLEEKKKQKKYLMQQLLTGEKRLPGFSGEWVRTKMSDVLELRNEKNTSEDLRICSVAVNNGVVDQVEHLGKSMAASDTSNYAVVHYGDIVYTKSPTGNFPYGIVKQSQLNENVAVSPLYGVYKPKTYELGFILHEYFSYASNANNYLLPIINKGAKNTINIADNTFLTPSLLLPKNDSEISKLAQVFKKANEEILIIQKSIDKEKQAKKALMQLLLTGIVRV